MVDEIMVLGVGNILYSDDGFGIRVVEYLQEHHRFPDHVTIVDGGVLGVNLLGVISNATQLIVVDTILNRGRPGDFHRLEGDAIPRRILGKNSMHQVDLLEALTLCNLMGHAPDTVILGVEPRNVTTLHPELTPEIAEKIEPMAAWVIEELKVSGISFTQEPKNEVMKMENEVNPPVFPQLNKPAPNFEVKTTHGVKKLEDYKGR